MEAFVLHGPRDLRREFRPVSELTDSEVRIRVRRTGICGSDIAYYLHGAIGDFVPRNPLVLGHEVAGEIVDVGRSVKDLIPGTVVLLDPQIPCWQCRYCRDGRYNLCASMKFVGTAACHPHIDGGFAQYVTVPGSSCYEVPAGVGFAGAALAEPLSIAVHALQRATTPRSGASDLLPILSRSILITGAGSIGQLVLRVAKAYGAVSVTVTDPVEARRVAARRAGADAVVDPNESESELMRDGDSGFDIAIEASGSPRALAQAYHAVRRGGTIVQVGTQHGKITLPANLIMSKELAVVGAFRSVHVMPTVVELLRSRGAELETVITSVHPFESLEEAMDTAVNDRSSIKVQIEQ